MLIRRRPSWELPESAATPEAVYLSRRHLLGAGAGLAAALGLGLPAVAAPTPGNPDLDPTKDLYPAKRNEKYGIGDRPITPEEINGNYNNFYEVGTSKNVTKAAQQLRIRHWTVKIDGMAEKPFAIGV